MFSRHNSDTATHHHHPTAKDISSFVLKYKAVGALALSCAAINSALHVHLIFEKVDSCAHFASFVSAQTCFLSSDSCQASDAKKFRPDGTLKEHNSCESITRAMCLRLKCFGMASALMSKLAYGAKPVTAYEKVYVMDRGCNRHFRGVCAAASFRCGRPAIIIDRLHFKSQVKRMF
jgi:hypothetical protein